MIRKYSVVINLLFITLFYLPSCSRNIYQTVLSPPVLYPSSSDTARIQFLTRYDKSTDITGGQSGFKSFVLGKEPELPIVKPYGLASYSDKILIADPGSKGIEIIDLENKTFEYFKSSGKGSLSLPVNCIFDTDGNLYVVDVEKRNVLIFDPKFNYLDKIQGDSSFKPTDVIVLGDTIYVTDPNNHRINAYEKSQKDLIFNFPDTEDQEENRLYNPINLSSDGKRIFVTDVGHSKIKIYTREGQYISSIGGFGKTPGSFSRPKGTAVDRDGILYVVDAGFQNIQMFNNEGQLLMFFGGAYNGPGDMYLPAKVTIDYNQLKYFTKYVDPDYSLQYLIFVTNQYGPDKVNVYGRIIPK